MELFQIHNFHGEICGLHLEKTKWALMSLGSRGSLVPNEFKGAVGYMEPY